MHIDFVAQRLLTRHLATFEIRHTFSILVNSKMGWLTRDFVFIFNRNSDSAVGIPIISRTISASTLAF